MRILRRLSLAIGVFLIALGVATAVFGVLRTSFLAETTGLVTGALVAPGTTFGNTRLMFYQYTADGTKYSGMTRLQLEDLQDGAGQLNRTIQVFYKRGHPATGYAVYRPSLNRWLRFSALLGVIGILTHPHAKASASNRAMEPTAERRYARFSLFMNALRNSRGGSSSSR